MNEQPPSKEQFHVGYLRAYAVYFRKPHEEREHGIKDSYLRYCAEEMDRAAAEIERLRQRLIDIGVENLGDNDEYARCRSIDDEQIVREAMETPIRLVHELGNRYDVVCEKLERAAPEPRAGWQPVDTAPKDRDVFFWIMPNRGFSDTSGNPIVSSEPPRMFYGRYGRWSSLMKAALWHEGPTPPPGEEQ